MSARDILDVLNVQRDELPGLPSKKRKKLNSDSPMPRQTGMARELYNLLGPNTPPVHLGGVSGGGGGLGGLKDKMNLKPSPWTRLEFNPQQGNDSKGIKLYHWVKGSRELLEQEQATKEYLFAKFNTGVEIPELVGEELYEQYMQEFEEKEEEEIVQARLEAEARRKKEEERRKERAKNEEKKQAKEQDKDQSKDEQDKDQSKDEQSKGEQINDKNIEVSIDDAGAGADADADAEVDTDTGAADNTGGIVTVASTWTYEETKYLWDLCKAFELKWPIIHDRYTYDLGRTQEDLKEQFYRLSAKALDSHDAQSKALIDGLELYSKSKETERKQYLENLLKRTPAEIAEEESLVIEARRFELAAKKMLIERSHLLTLLDSPQSSQSILQYNSSQGLATLYNNLMIMDKNQKKKQGQLQKVQNSNFDPVPPAIPVAASSSFKKERVFQTPLQQHLAGVLKSNQSNNIKLETNSIQQLLMKRLTQKEEEAYGLHYHSNEKLNPGVLLRSAQKLPGLQQRQSVLKSVSTLLQELDVPTGGGTSWKPVMPTRKTMAKYDELIRSVVALLEMKKGKDRLEAEIRLIKSQKGLE
ncbi:swr complex subunit [Scheffersomyces spartinae]|uniref:SWR1-complex protein 4 n=1 Tax=Scheffersomyces spartinae TaxID=45513 RepID=A0A9P7V5J2_9ASCO|nr:swr complex subunit [Scheffersomyces spartinae]KAG7191551.1 swr complex subunit [Scheffersomyces spartinae]